MFDRLSRIVASNEARARLLMFFWLVSLLVMLIGFGLLNDDGLFLLAGLIVGGLVIGLLSAAVGLIVAAMKRLFPWWFPPSP